MLEVRLGRLGHPPPSPPVVGFETFVSPYLPSLSFFKFWVPPYVNYSEYANDWLPKRLPFN